MRPLRIEWITSDLWQVPKALGKHWFLHPEAFLSEQMSRSHSGLLHGILCTKGPSLNPSSNVLPDLDMVALTSDNPFPPNGKRSCRMWHLVVGGWGATGAHY